MVGSVPVGADLLLLFKLYKYFDYDIKSTINQIISCADAGADIIRVSCPDLESTNLKTIVKESPIPSLLIFIITKGDKVTADFEHI